jgi:hypothetical protein
MRTLGLLAGAAVLLAGACAREPEPLRVSEIVVNTDLPAIQGPQAVAYWQDLSQDLETAMAAEFVGRIDPLGSSVLVDVDELSLTTAFVPGATVEDAQLSGRVTVENPDGTTAAAYDVTASASDAVAYLPEGANVVQISPTSDEYYQAIVRAFARGAATAVLTGQPA